MPPKSNDAIKASTVIDLKAQVAEHKEKFNRQRGPDKMSPAAARKSDKKPTVWARQNKGIAARAERDKVHRLDDVESHVLQKSREALERKAKLYEDMCRRVKEGSDDEDEDESQLIDFDQKYWQERERRAREEEAKKAKKKRQRNDDDENDEENPWVEYVDEFGRPRVVRQSDLPSRSPSPARSRSGSPEPWIPRDREEFADRASILHYDADREIRTKGVGFYSFAKDEAARETERQELERLRQETLAARRNTQSSTDKRKALLAAKAEQRHARMAEIRAKRRKPNPVPEAATPSTPIAPATPIATTSPNSAIKSKTTSPPPPPLPSIPVPPKKQTLSEFLKAARRKAGER